MSDHKWMSSGFLRAAPAGAVNAEKGVIEGVSVCTVGEAKGHGVNLDSEFIETVRAFGAEKKQGLKARFGHPNMCSTSLGTFIGRFKNFAIDGDQVRADLFLSNEAKETPHGNLHAYVLGMAKNEPDMFGTSIVFTPGREYKRTSKGEKIYYPGWNPDGDETRDEHSKRLDEWDQTPGPLYVECEALHACDTVDDPAANDGLFSRFSQETIAGQVSEFLDLHPQVWEAIESNPSILEALARYGDKMDEFTTRYREYREHNGGNTMPQKPTDSEQLEEVVEEPSATGNTEEQEVIETPAEPEASEPEAAAETPAEEPSEDEPADSGNLSAALEESQAQRAALVLRAEAAETELQAAIVARDEAVASMNAADEARRVAESKLAAIENGQQAVSAEPAEGKESGSLMQRARRKK